MVEKEKRRYIRVDSINLLNFIYFDENLKEESQGMGRTLNLSEAGLLLETNSLFKVKRELSLNIGLKEKVLSINGTVIFSDNSESGLRKSGIKFAGIGADELDTLKRHIQTSHV